MFNIKLDENNLRNIEYNLENMQGKFPNAVSFAINRTLEMVKTEQLRRTIERYTIKRGKLTESIKLFKSNTGNLQGKVYSSGKVIGFDHFKLNPKTRKYGEKVAVGIKKDGMKHLPNAFIAYHDGRLGAFERTSNKSLPIKRLMGPSSPQMLGEMSILEYLQGFAEEKFNIRFEHEMRRLLK